MTRSVFPAVVEAVYPKTCAGCGMRGMWLCDMCEASVPEATIPASCHRCGVPRLTGRCGCRDLPVVITRARAAYVYDGWVATAVKRMKYDGEWSRAEQLAAEMSPRLVDFGAVDGVIPVPLHRSRERSRGYNQSVLLASHLETLTGVRMLDVLRRSRKTMSQVALSGEQRKENVAGAFEIDPDWAPAPGGRYVIVDDVRTTGATLGACAKALQDTHPESIGVLTFALDLRSELVAALRNQSAGAGVNRDGMS